MINRILEYAKGSGIDVLRDPHYFDWGPWGLPDLRGFTPHLRRVRTLKKTKSNLWMVHDLLHVLFYDFALSILGPKCFEDHRRFIEVHLASELFAVFALDYSHLIPQKKGLAVELNIKKWNYFEKHNKHLPDIQTFEFCKKLSELYLAGESQWLDCPALEKDKDYTTWTGHEIRYTEKQRLYAQMWWFDLNENKFNKKIPVLKGSIASEIVWELTDLLLSAGERQWAETLDRIQKGVKNRKNMWQALPKYKGKTEKKNVDFRFTSIQALEKTELNSYLMKAKRPTASSLYFMWQLLSFTDPKLFSNYEKKRIQNLAIESQKTTTVDSETYGHVWQILRQRPLPEIPLNKQLISCFFLP